jgi:hypothetical protein
MLYFGVVEDRMDPEHLGRCRVRIVGVHSEDKVALPTKDLPWAWPIMPLNSASVSGVGETPLGPVAGSWVAIMFRDPQDMQQPIMIGTVGGKPSERPPAGSTFADPNAEWPRTGYYQKNQPDTNKLARAEHIEDTIVAKKAANRMPPRPILNSGPPLGVWTQPPAPYFPIYPYNHVTETESGHVREYDDTPTSERIHHYHKAGTFEEIDPNGSVVRRIVGNGYEIIDHDGFVSIDGCCVIHVSKDAAIQVAGAAHVTAVKNVNVQSLNAKVNVTAPEKITLTAGSDLQLICKNLLVDASGNISMKASGKMDVSVSGEMKLQASTIYEECGADPTDVDRNTWTTFDTSQLWQSPLYRFRFA